MLARLKARELRAGDLFHLWGALSPALRVLAVLTPEHDGTRACPECGDGVAWVTVLEVRDLRSDERRLVRVIACGSVVAERSDA